MKNSKAKFFLLSLLIISGSCIRANASRVYTAGSNGATVKITSTSNNASAGFLSNSCGRPISAASGFTVSMPAGTQVTIGGNKISIVNPSNGTIMRNNGSGPVPLKGTAFVYNDLQNQNALLGNDHAGGGLYKNTTYVTGLEVTSGSIQTANGNSYGVGSTVNQTVDQYTYTAYNATTDTQATGTTAANNAN